MMPDDINKALKWRDLNALCELMKRYGWPVNTTWDDVEKHGINAGLEAARRAILSDDPHEWQHAPADVRARKERSASRKVKRTMVLPSENERRDNEFLYDLRIWKIRLDSFGRIVV